MNRLLSAALFALLVSAQQKGPTLPYTQEESAIRDELRGMRKLSDHNRAQATVRLAGQIRALPVTSVHRLGLAGGLASLCTEGDFGRDSLRSVAATLTAVLTDTPVPLGAKGPAHQYVSLAQLARYEGITVSLSDPAYLAAAAKLAEDDQARAEADFTLQDVTGKPWHLKELKGKVVLVNFWATWCPPCRKEMPDLDELYRKHRKQGFVVLALSDEPGGKVVPFAKESGYSFPFLMDRDGAAAKQFRVDSIPKSFVFDRAGKLVAQAIDMRTKAQFVEMLKKAGL